MARIRENTEKEIEKTNEQTEETKNFEKDYLPETLASFLIDFPSYFNNRGYQIDHNFTQQFLEISPLFFDSQSLNFEDLEDFIRPLAIKNKVDNYNFHNDFLEYIKRSKNQTNGIKEKDQRNLDSIQNRYKGFEKEKQRLKNEEQRLRKEIENEKNNPIPKLANDKKIKQYENKQKEIEKSFRKVFSGSDCLESLMEIGDIISGKKKNDKKLRDISHMEETLMEKMPEIIKEKRAIDLMEFIRLQTEMLKLMKKDIEGRQYENKEQKLENNLRQQKNVEERLEKARKNFQEEAKKIIEKSKESVNHRQNFILKNNRAVKGTDKGEVMLDKSFEQLTNEDKQMIKDYIRENARKFRTRISHNIRTNEKHDIDIAETIKTACGTDGIPLKLKFVKQKRKKTKLVLFLDISGSCKEASELMLNFMGEMREVFPGGCKTFVFVNTLYDVSDIYSEAINASEATKTILSTIPTRGIYSDYNVPLKTFCEEKFQELTKDSIVFFIGDARNNKNPTGEDYLKAISRRVKKTFWLNTEEKSMWNVKDSIFGIYAKYMNDYCECCTPRDLIEFLVNVR